MLSEEDAWKLRTCIQLADKTEMRLQGAPEEGDMKIILCNLRTVSEVLSRIVEEHTDNVREAE